MTSIRLRTLERYPYFYGCLSWFIWKKVTARYLERTVHKGQWRGALMISSICARTHGGANNGEAGDLKRHRAHYGVIVMDLVSFYIPYNVLPSLYHFVPFVLQINNVFFSFVDCLSAADNHVLLMWYFFISLRYGKKTSYLLDTISWNLL